MSETDKTRGGEQKIRMDPDHTFRFRCGRRVSCFTQCCQDVTIVLTPFCVLRLKRGLGITSDFFLDKYVVVLPQKKRLIPLVVLKMSESDKKCPFVSPEGCKIYEDRPWPCRMYPLDMNDDGTFRYIANPTHCLGLKERELWRIGDWLVDQGIVPYDEMNGLFTQITAPLQAQELDINNPDIEKMVFMALYNLDKFKEFIFKSSFLDRFDIDPITLEKINQNDIDLIKFGYNWIKFGLFGQKLFKLRPNRSKG